MITIETVYRFLTSDILELRSDENVKKIDCKVGSELHWRLGWVEFKLKLAQVQNTLITWGVTPTDTTSRTSVLYSLNKKEKT